MSDRPPDTAPDATPSSGSDHEASEPSDPGDRGVVHSADSGEPVDTTSMLMLAELERRVRSLESRVNELGRLARAPRWQIKTSDMVRWVLWLMVIGFLAFLWTRSGGLR